jgi:hypothetical protein
METERRLVFVGWETSTVDACGNGKESYVIDLDDCGYVIDGDDWHDDAVISELARDHGVPVADLWAAYQWRESIVRAGSMADVERFLENDWRYVDSQVGVES